MAPSATGDRRRTGTLLGGVLLTALVVALIGGGWLVIRLALESPSTANVAPHAAPASGAPSAAESLDAVRSAGATYLQNREFTNAQAILTKAIERFPDDRDLRLSLAQALIGQDKFADAYDQYEKVIALEQRSEAGAKTTDAAGGKGGGGAGADLHFQAGTLASKAGLIDRAEEHYSMAQAADPTEPRYPLYLAMIQIKKGDTSGATKNLLLAIRLNPDLGEAWGTLAELELQANQLGLAQQHIAEARRLQPEVGRWKVVEAKAMKRDGKPLEAATLLLTLNEAEQRDKSVMRLLGECYGLLDKPADAAAMYVDAAAKSPTDPELAYDAAQWLQRAGNRDQALRFAKTSAMLGNPEARALVTALESRDN